jgi:hypothetical protein
MHLSQELIILQLQSEGQLKRGGMHMCWHIKNTWESNLAALSLYKKRIGMV